MGRVKMRLAVVLLVIFCSNCFSLPRGVREKRSPEPQQDQRHFFNNRPSNNYYSNGYRPNGYYGRPGSRPGGGGFSRPGGDFVNNALPIAAAGAVGGLGG